MNINLERWFHSWDWEIGVITLDYLLGQTQVHILCHLAYQWTRCHLKENKQPSKIKKGGGVSTLWAKGFVSTPSMNGI
jgi:hypothetical protein